MIGMAKCVTLANFWLFLPILRLGQTLQSQCPRLEFPDLSQFQINAEEFSKVSIRFTVTNQGCDKVIDDIKVNIVQENNHRNSSVNDFCHMRYKNSICNTSYYKMVNVCRCGEGANNYLFEKTVDRMDSGKWSWRVTRDQTLNQTIIFNITYPAVIHNFKVSGAADNSETTNVIVPQSSTVRFSCDWDNGNPLTSARLLDNSGRLLNISGEQGRQITYFTKTNLSCVDSGRYSCQQDSDKNGTSAKWVDIFVECAPVFTENNIAEQTGEGVMVEIPFRSFSSSLTSCAVTKSVAMEKKTSGENSSFNCSSLGFQVSGEPPDMKLIINFSQPLLKESMIWRLHIANNLGSCSTDISISQTGTIANLVTIAKSTEQDRESHTALVITIATTMSVLIIVIIIFIVIFLVKKVRKSPSGSDDVAATVSQPSPVYRNSSGRELSRITNRPDKRPDHTSVVEVVHPTADYASSSDTTPLYGAPGADGHQYQILNADDRKKQGMTCSNTEETSSSGKKPTGLSSLSACFSGLSSKKSHYLHPVASDEGKDNCQLQIIQPFPSVSSCALYLHPVPLAKELKKTKMNPHASAIYNNTIQSSKHVHYLHPVVSAQERYEDELVKPQTSLASGSFLPCSDTVDYLRPVLSEKEKYEDEIVKPQTSIASGRTMPCTDTAQYPHPMLSERENNEDKGTKLSPTRNVYYNVCESSATVSTENKMEEKLYSNIPPRSNSVHYLHPVISSTERNHDLLKSIVFEN